MTKFLRIIFQQFSFCFMQTFLNRFILSMGSQLLFYAINIHIFIYGIKNHYRLSIRIISIFYVYWTSPLKWIIFAALGSLSCCMHCRLVRKKLLSSIKRRFYHKMADIYTAPMLFTVSLI